MAAEQGDWSLDRWRPDEQLVAAVLHSPRAPVRMADLDGPDRSWVVAGLTVAGMTAQEIADRLGCSLRLVRSIRAMDMTQVCVYAYERVAEVEAELSETRSALVAERQGHARTRAEVGRLREQLDRLVVALRRGEGVRVCSAGHALVGYNAYRRGGRVFCRECARLRAAAYRARRRETCADRQDHTCGVTVSGSVGVVSAR